MSAKSVHNRSASGARESSTEDTANARPRATTEAPESRREDGRGEDVALVCGLTDDGQGMEVIRKRGERIETGTVRRLEPGKPIHGEVVRLRPRPHAPFVCDVDVEYAPTDRRPARDDAGEAAPSLAANTGPAQVATESYRKNWDAIYGRRKPPLLN